MSEHHFLADSDEVIEFDETIDEGFEVFVIKESLVTPSAPELVQSKRRRWKPFLAATVTALAAFAPWAWDSRLLFSTRQAASIVGAAMPFSPPAAAEVSASTVESLEVQLLKLRLEQERSERLAAEHEARIWKQQAEALQSIPPPPVVKPPVVPAAKAKPKPVGAKATNTKTTRKEDTTKVSKTRTKYPEELLPILKQILMERQRKNNP